MAIQFQCPSCDAIVKVPDSAAGKVGRCPKCDTRVQIPEVAAPPPAAFAPHVPPLPDFEPPPITSPLLGDKSTVFVLPPAVEPSGPPVIGPPPEPVAPPPPPPPEPANPVAAREEFDVGRQWLNKPFVPGAGWPPALRAVLHFTKAARLDPKNSDYATHAGIACQVSIDRFLESWGKGPVTSIAAFHLDQPLGQQIDRTEKLFRPSGLSAENLDLIRSQANDALQWFEKALALDPEDTITRCHRAQLLMQIGAFPQAMADAKAVLSSPVVPSKTRDAAQKVADFILEEDSPLRKFLTRTQAQQLPAPTGIDLPKPVTKAAAPSPAPTVAEMPFAIHTGAPKYVSPAALAPTVPEEMPLLATAGRPDPASSSVAARLKRRPKASWVNIAIPIVLGLALVGIGLGYMYMTRVRYVATLTGDDLGNTTLRKIIYGNEFSLPEDRLERLLSNYRDDPETIRTPLRVMTLRGSSQGIEVSIRPGEKGRLVRVDLRSHAPLNAFSRDHAAKLEAPLPVLRAETLQRFASDFEQARSAGMKLGNVSEYLKTLGGDLLVHGLGYHVEAVSPAGNFPCIFEDEAGMLFFLVPQGTETFEIVPRAFEPPVDVFQTDFKYTVQVKAAPPPPAAAPAPPPAAAPEPSPPPETASDAEPPSEPLPANFFGEKD